VSAKPLYGVALLALLGLAIALALHRAPPNTAVVDVPEPTSADEPPTPPQDFAAEFMASRAEALIDEARDQALAAARDEEQARSDAQRSKLFGPTAKELRASIRPLSRMQIWEQRAQRYESEAVDRTWAAGAEAQILEKISQTGVKALDLRVECKTTVCRLELLEPASERLNSVKIGVALLQVAELEPSFAREVDSPAGTRTTVAYLARK
jgi:hypothetical protein